MMAVQVPARDGLAVMLEQIEQVTAGEAGGAGDQNRPA